MPVYALTIFLGAFLLFQVQPLIGKYILPWFGGGPNVWTTCMLFFQVALLVGYTYAHFISQRLSKRAQVILHLLLLAAALVSLPIIPNDSWKPLSPDYPVLKILVLLGACLGLPYFVLSTTGPLMQRWFTLTHPGISPYRLFALSNAGSLLALISYPIYFETHFTRRVQATLWAIGLAVYAVACGVCAWKLWTDGQVRSAKDEGRDTSSVRSPSLNPRPSSFDLLLWLLLPACASILLLATTNKICQEVAVVPFLWVLPLALYLLSFIICFDNPRWYQRFPFAIALVAAMAGFCWALFEGTNASIWQQVAVYSGGLFVCCMVCHGELYRMRPGVDQLTHFYLMVALGGALGGVLVAVIAPLVFVDYYELHCGILLCGLLFVIICASKRNPISDNQWRWLACALTLAGFGAIDQLLVWSGRVHKVLPNWGITGIRITVWFSLALFVGLWSTHGRFGNFRHSRSIACLWLCVGLIALSGTLWKQGREAERAALFRSRNFYGVLKVFEYRVEDPKEHYYLLQHGRITHGLQFADPEQAKWPTSYYGEGSGVDIAVNALPGNRRIGVLGLGTGTTAALARPGDYVRIYEINPDVERVATTRFSYLSNCAGTFELGRGDARLSMEREPPQQFDLLVMDAFTSDSIPVHLLTREAFQVYQKHMKTNGIVAVHISNHFLDLEPVVINLAREFGYRLAKIDYEENEDEGGWWLYSSTWMLLSRNDKIMNSSRIVGASSSLSTNSSKVPLWTDDFASLFQILKK